jgi:uncharacterized protein with HEPN domain
LTPDDRVRLNHIADALESAILFTAQRRREDLDHDTMLRFALLYATQIVGDGPAGSVLNPATNIRMFPGRC